MHNTIGLFGLTFDSGNMGCQALAYSFYYILKDIPQIETVYVFSEGDCHLPSLCDKNFELIPVQFSSKSIKSLRQLHACIKKCDLIFDFTDGDSFSDIYGIKRLIRASIPKVMTIWSKKPLVLGAQTYGPYYNYFGKKIAKYIISHSEYTCSRDALSAELVYKLCGKRIDVYTDIAFALPYEGEEKGINDKKKIGINVSGLLWRGGYTGQNQFGLKTNYQEYITSLITDCLNRGYEVHLIPHVITKNYDNSENDLSANDEIKKLFPAVICAPSFTNPMQAKKYLSSLDVFVGARMHATIGAFSSGTVTIPFSYSKKFEGLYNSVDYPYVIHAKEWETEEALSTTKKYIEECEMLRDAQIKSMEMVQIKLQAFNEKIRSLVEKWL